MESSLTFCLNKISDHFLLIGDEEEESFRVACCTFSSNLINFYTTSKLLPQKAYQGTQMQHGISLDYSTRQIASFLLSGGTTLIEKIPETQYLVSAITNAYDTLSQLSIFDSTKEMKLVASFDPIKDSGK